MDSYIHENIADSAKYFLEKFLNNLAPPDFRTKRTDIFFLNNLAYSYTHLLEFCSNHGFFKLTKETIKEVNTFRGCLSYQNKEWKMRKDIGLPFLESKTLLHIQAKLENLLEFQLLARSKSENSSYKAFQILLKEKVKKHFLIGVYYQDERGNLVFYFLDCNIETHAQTNTLSLIQYQKDKTFCDRAIKQLIAHKEQGTYTSIQGIAVEMGVTYVELISIFKRHYGYCLYEAYKQQRLIYGLELLLFSDRREGEIAEECHYNNYPDFCNYFTKGGLSPSKIRRFYDRK